MRNVRLLAVGIGSALAVVASLSWPVFAQVGTSSDPADKINPPVSNCNLTPDTDTSKTPPVATPITRDLLTSGQPCQALAHAIEPTRTLFNAMRARNISVFFITGRRNSQRDATLLNLDHAGFEGWTKLITRPDNDSGSIVPFKSGERAKIASAGYTIIATIGDQQSDIDGGSAECGFKLPNPFYFVE